MRCKLLTPKLKVEDGRMALPAGLGVSVDLSTEAVEGYRSQQIRLG